MSPIPGSPNQLSATWSPPIPKNGIITAYTVYCNTSASQAYPEQVIGPNVPSVRSVVNGSTLAVTFNAGLNPYTHYDCYVTANTSVGEGMQSNIVSNRTAESCEQNRVFSAQGLRCVIMFINLLSITYYIVAGPVTLLNQISNTLTTVTLIWSRPVVPNGVIIGYQVLLGTVIYNSSTTKIVISGLNVSMSYNISVVALTAKGSGQPTYLQAATATFREYIILLSVLTISLCVLH